MLKQLLLVGLGGGVGSILRYLTSVCLSRYFSYIFPLATFAVNIIGCFLMGLLFGLTAKYDLLNNDLKLLLMIGFCGGYTTFSAFSIENMQLIGSGNYLLSSIYIVGSVLLGIAAVWLGSLLMR